MERKDFELKAIKHQATGYTRITYVQILFRGTEVGFIAPEGIFLRMYSPYCREGVLRPIEAPKTDDVNTLKTFLEKHLEAIMDRYITTFRKDL